MSASNEEHNFVAIFHSDEQVYHEGSLFKWYYSCDRGHVIDF